MKEKWIQTASKIENLTFLQKQRDVAIEKLREISLPTIKDEEWKFFNIKPFFEKNYQEQTPYQNSIDIGDFSFLTTPNPKIVFLNGVFSKELSHISSLDKGLQMCPFSQIDESVQEKLLKKINTSKGFEKDPMTVFNSALLQDGVVIHIQKGVKLSHPIEVIYIYDSHIPIFHANRSVILLDEYAQGTFIEYFYTHGACKKESTVFANRVNEVFLSSHAHFSHYIVQEFTASNFFIGSTTVSMDSWVRCDNHTISFNEGVMRNMLTYCLNGEESEGHMNGISCLRKQAIINNYTQMRHLAPNTRSDENYRGLYNDRAKGVFNGEIIVDSQAQKTNAFQSNKNILLSDKASIFSKPQLKIWADDVKCSHGATTGKLDMEALFYFRTRGIAEKKAKSILLLSFLYENMEKIEIPQLKDRIKQKLIEQLNNL